LDGLGRWKHLGRIPRRKKRVRLKTINLRKLKHYIAKSEVFRYTEWVSAVQHYSTQGGARMFSYNKLWKMLIDRNMIKKDLMAETNITSSTMAKMGKGLPVNMETLGRICEALDCDIGDIVDYVKE